VNASSLEVLMMRNFVTAQAECEKPSKDSAQTAIEKPPSIFHGEKF
jgi:hypothetical protein